MHTHTHTCIQYRVIYVTDQGQSEHFEMIFIAAQKAGWCPAGTRLDHVPFGLVSIYYVCEFVYTCMDGEYILCVCVFVYTCMDGAPQAHDLITYLSGW